MTDLTRVKAFKTLNAAKKAAGILNGDGYNVVLIDGTDAIELSDGGGSLVTWESGSEVDWTLLIASKKAISTQ